jgi:lipopolysaccharide/colanic/teichoic acid biosynthesis glycosyltransferase
MASRATNTKFSEESRPIDPFPPDVSAADKPTAPLDAFSSDAQLPFPTSKSKARQPAAVPEIPAPTVARLIPRERAYGLCALLLIGDWIAACAAIFTGLELRELQRTGSILQSGTLFDFRTSPIPWSFAGGILFIWLMVMFKTYEVLNLYRMRLWSKNLVRSVTICSVVVWAYIGLFQATGYTPRVGVAYCAVTLICFACLWRLTSFIFLIQPDVKEAASSRLIVVGWNEKVAHLRKAMRRDLAQLSEIIGCVPMPGGAFASKPPTELAVLGDYSDLPRLVADCSANSLILSEVTCSAKEIQHLVLFCQREMIGFQMVPEYFPALSSSLRIQTLSGVPLLGVGQMPLDRMLNRTIKRVMDVVGAVIGLCLGAIFIPLFGLLVRLESSGPMLTKERRTSRSGRTFYIYKIRTAQAEALSNCDGREFQRTNAPLKIGRFMQKYDIDELPQFWNVLTGDMSLVGPHPERPEVIEKLKDEIPNFNARYEVRAGLTGWAQVNGIKGDTNVVRGIEGDLYYLENWSVMVDLYCIVATVFRAASERQSAPDTEK